MRRFRRLARVAPILTLLLPLGACGGDETSQARSVDTPAVECPASVSCIWSPAAYAQNSPDPTDYGNYYLANRPTDIPITGVVIHDTESKAAESGNLFEDPHTLTSAHYIVYPDGHIEQKVHLKNVAWHAGNMWLNARTIGIEHVGHAANGAVEYTPAMYQTSAELVKWLADQHNFPLDRQHILGHDNVPPPTGAVLVEGLHSDPGLFWDWKKYLSLLGVPAPASPTPGGKLAVITPPSPIQEVLQCQGGTCTALPPYPTNFLYLRTKPSFGASFVSDPVLGLGTTAIDNTVAKVFYGQQYVIADQIDQTGGTWYAIWYGGQKAWFYSPQFTPTARAVNGLSVSPKLGHNDIPVFGRAVPGNLAQTLTAPPPPIEPLPYRIQAGQHYAAGDTLNADHYDIGLFGNEGRYVTTETKYVAIQFNNRLAFVRLEDVDVTRQ